MHIWTSNQHQQSVVYENTEWLITHPVLQGRGERIPFRNALSLLWADHQVLWWGRGGREGTALRVTAPKYLTKTCSPWREESHGSSGALIMAARVVNEWLTKEKMHSRPGSSRITIGSGGYYDAQHHLWVSPSTHRKEIRSDTHVRAAVTHSSTNLTFFLQIIIYV